MGDSGLVDRLEADARLMSYQAQVAQRLEVSVLCGVFACMIRCVHRLVQEQSRSWSLGVAEWAVWAMHQLYSW